ncbi:cardiolipin synthase ClsB [Curvibacter sp. CHRR-16]|uniref:phospholipase D-like domain-containing protein n=1 Tax=Curvibacter sp. CHRR-16 TaxID=2835872 RepID=UPI001BDA0BB5|nr:phospholipase D-like domain-containing protein [Curvibacter sp. CHRR-16]MBT0569659.1 cardiolipin synthase ClsB [Curvibacter sp. CHRR-16]
MGEFVSTDIRLLQGAHEWFDALLADIHCAQREILLETYTVAETGRVVEVFDALIAAAKRGVHVALLADALGCGEAPHAWLYRLHSAGIHTKLYAPLRRMDWLLPGNWHRLHRKLCVIDAYTVYCGGMNLLDDYWDPHHGHLVAPRLDFAVRLQGSIALAVRAAMHTAKVALPLQTLPKARVTPRSVGQGWEFLLRDNFTKRVRIEKAYLRAIGRAQSEVWIANAYFLPGRKMRHALMRAAARGVDVRLFLQGRYEYFWQYHGARAIYGMLLASGVKIYEYKASFLHAKVAVVDACTTRPWFTVGSSNLDPLSLLLNLEANVAGSDAAFALVLRERLDQLMHSAGHAVEPTAYAARSLTGKVREWLAYSLMRAMLWLAGRRY